MREVSFKPVIIFAINTASDKYFLETNSIINFKEVVGVYKGKKERAYVVAYSDLPRVLDLAKQFNQESILISGNDRNSHLLYMDGKIEAIGTLQRVSSNKGLDAYTIDNGQVWTCKKASNEGI